MYVSLPSFCSFVQESNACNHLFCNVIWSGPCNSSFCNSSLEQRIWERDECGWAVRPSSPCLPRFAFFKCASLSVVNGLLGKLLAAAAQARGSSFSHPHLSLCVSVHPSSLISSLLPPPRPPLLIPSNQLSCLVFIASLPSSAARSPHHHQRHPPLLSPSSGDTNHQVPSICVYVSN